MHAYADGARQHDGLLQVCARVARKAHRGGFRRVHPSHPARRSRLSVRLVARPECRECVPCMDCTRTLKVPTRKNAGPRPRQHGLSHRQSTCMICIQVIHPNPHALYQSTFIVRPTTGNRLFATAFVWRQNSTRAGRCQRAGCRRRIQPRRPRVQALIAQALIAFLAHAPGVVAGGRAVGPRRDVVRQPVRAHLVRLPRRPPVSARLHAQGEGRESRLDLKAFGDAPARWCWCRQRASPRARPAPRSL